VKARSLVFETSGTADHRRFRFFVPGSFRSLLPSATSGITSPVPVYHECQRCTACCRWPGDVRLTEGEIARIAPFAGMTEVEFIQRFTRSTKDRCGLSLLEKPNGECVFLEGTECSIQSVKPQQCRDFPNLWNFPGFEKSCESIPRLVDAEQYVRLVAMATGRSEDYVRTIPTSD